MDNNSKLVARLSTAVSGSPRLTTSSEVATMSYLRSHTTIPVPKTLDWSNNSLNSVGAEYIIMEHIEGIRLSERWIKMTRSEQLKCTTALAMMFKEMANLEFSTYGSLYFADSLSAMDSKVSISKDYCVGPHCGPIYGKCGIGEARLYGNETPNRGPWKDLPSFCKGIIETGLSRLPKIDVGATPAYRGDVGEHIRLLAVSQQVINELIKHAIVQKAATPMLLHPDFNNSNILVSNNDPTIITGVIDWQSASIQPAFMHTMRTPDFVALLEEFPLVTKVSQGAESEEQEPNTVSICDLVFDIIMDDYAPKLQAARNSDESFFRLFHFCLTTWTASATAIRAELVRLSSRWDELGLGGSCPYTITDEELVAHEKLYLHLENVVTLKKGLMPLFGADHDGHVSNDTWKKINPILPEIREMLIKVAVENGDTEEAAMEMFPFDGK